jgi:hypothetical protein
MRKEYRQAVYDACQKRAHTIWNGESTLKKGAGLTICEFWNNSNPKRLCFIRFRSHHQAEAFGIEIGWNTKNEIPAANYTDERYFDFERGALQLTSNAIGLRLLVEGDELTWDVIEINEILNKPQILVERITKEQAAERVAKAIQEAFTMLVNHGLPYLDRASHYTTNL